MTGRHPKTLNDSRRSRLSRRARRFDPKLPFVVLGEPRRRPDHDPTLPAEAIPWVRGGLQLRCRQTFDQSGDRMASTRRLAAVLAADVAGYSRLMGADEDGTLAALKATRR